MSHQQNLPPNYALNANATPVIKTSPHFNNAGTFTILTRPFTVKVLQNNFTVKSTCCY